VEVASCICAPTHPHPRTRVRQPFARFPIPKLLSPITNGVCRKLYIVPDNCKPYGNYGQNSTNILGCRRADKSADKSPLPVRVSALPRRYKRNATQTPTPGCGQKSVTCPRFRVTSVDLHILAEMLDVCGVSRRFYDFGRNA
jgi:hypothetical protein